MSPTSIGAPAARPPDAEDVAVWDADPLDVLEEQAAISPPASTTHPTATAARRGDRARHDITMTPPLCHPADAARGRYHALDRSVHYHWVVTGSLTIEPLHPAIGAELVGADAEQLLVDPDVPALVHGALDRHGLLVLRGIGLDDAAQVAFGSRLGQLVRRAGNAVPEITPITQDSGNRIAEYLRGNTQWHIDGAMDPVPCKYGILTARQVAPGDGGTELASTYVAFDRLPAADQQRLSELQVLHSLAATMRGVYLDPTPDQTAAWTRQPARQHPLVWQHRNGRRSLVIGATADSVVGMDDEAGQKLLSELLAMATQPDLVFRHDWTIGDMVIWDNTGALHRVTEHNATSNRRLHRATVAGDEAITAARQTGKSQP